MKNKYTTETQEVLAIYKDILENDSIISKEAALIAALKIWKEARKDKY